MYQVGYFLTRNATMYPDKTAVIYNDEKLTYRQLNIRANRLANNLTELGIKKGDRVAVVMQNSLEIVVLWHATQKIGATFLPVNLRLMANEVAHILNDSRCTALVYTEKFAELVYSVLPSAPGIGLLIYKGSAEGLRGLALEPLLFQGDESEPKADILGEDGSVILYTSGTTGLPKGVLHTQQQVKEYSYMMALETEPPNKPAVVLVQSPMFHLGGMQHIWRMAALCGTLVMVNKVVPEEIFRNIQRYQVSEFYLLPPILIKRLYDCPDWKNYDRSSVRSVMCTGGKCSRNISDMIFELFPESKIRLSYGSTEMLGPLTTYVTKEMIQARPELATTIGTINNQYEMRLVDENMNDVPDGRPGEALVRSPMIFRGYINLPEKNKTAFDDEGWFHSEDLLRRTPDGYYFIEDRIKDMIKTGGENVFSQEVETVLRDIPGVFACAVVGVPDPEMGEGVAAAIVTYDGKALEPDSFLAECRARMPGYRKPRYWAFMKELPVNSVGKIQKSVLREHPEWFERIKAGE